MTVKEYIKQHGTDGVEECEKMVEITSTILTTIIVEDGTSFRRKKSVEVACLCYFGDTDEVQAYCLDTDNNGWFCKWDDLSDNVKYKICNALLAFD